MGGCERDVVQSVQRIGKGYYVTTGVRIGSTFEECMYEGGRAPMALYGQRTAERRKPNVLEMCLSSLVCVT